MKRKIHAPLYRYLGRKKGLVILYLIINPINSCLELLSAYAQAVAIDAAVGGTLEQLSGYVAAFAVYIVVWFIFSVLHG